MTAPDPRTAPPVRALVVGLGAIGGLVMGGMLLHPPGVVELVGLSTNPGIADALDAHGFRLVGLRAPSVRFGAVARSVDALQGPFSLIFLAVQPPQAVAAIREVAHLLAADGEVVLLQNGLPEDIIGEVVGHDRVIGAVVTWGASQEAPGVYAQTSPGGFILGRASGQIDAKVEQVAALLSPVGEARPTANIRGARWSKLAINASISTLGTLGGDTLGHLMRAAVVRRLFLEIVTETVAVARAEGVTLAPVSSALDVGKLALSPEEQRGGPRLWLKHAVLIVVGMKYRRMRSSMLSAIERGRPPAVDLLNGEVVRRGAALGVPTPVNSRATALVHSIARGEEKMGMELVRRLAAEVGVG